MRGRGRPAACWATPPLKHPKLMGRGADLSSAPARGACAFRSERRRRISQISHASVEIKRLADSEVMKMSSTHRATPSLDTQAAHDAEGDLPLQPPEAAAPDACDDLPVVTSKVVTSKKGKVVTSKKSKVVTSKKGKVVTSKKGTVVTSKKDKAKAIAEMEMKVTEMEMLWHDLEVAYPIIQNDNVEEYFTETKQWAPDPGQWAPDPGMPDAVALQATACIKDFACSGRKKNKQ